MRTVVVCCACFALVSGACASDDAENDPPAERNKQPEESTYLGLKKPTDGLQIRSIGEEIGPGEDWSSVRWLSCLETPTPSTW